MTRFERPIVWMGGALFVASLAYCAGSYAWRWGAAAPGGGWSAVAFNALLVSAFALHHSLFARTGMKRRLARHIPERLLRSTYVWLAAALLITTCAAWRPVGSELYRATGVQVWLHLAIQLAGVLVIARAVGALDPLELAGIRQPDAGPRPAMRVTGVYRLVRHPLYLGWILIVFGAAGMTGDRLAFAVLTTAYLVIAVPWEERSLTQTFGDEYQRYQRLVRWRMLPFIY